MDEILMGSLTVQGRPLLLPTCATVMSAPAIPSCPACVLQDLAKTVKLPSHHLVWTIAEASANDVCPEVIESLLRDTVICHHGVIVPLYRTSSASHGGHSVSSSVSSIVDMAEDLPSVVWKKSAMDLLRKAHRNMNKAETRKKVTANANAAAVGPLLTIDPPTLTNQNELEAFAAHGTRAVIETNFVGPVDRLTGAMDEMRVARDRHGQTAVEFPDGWRLVPEWVTYQSVSERENNRIVTQIFIYEAICASVPNEFGMFREGVDIGMRVMEWI